MSEVKQKAIGIIRTLPEAAEWKDVLKEIHDWMAANAQVQLEEFEHQIEIEEFKKSKTLKHDIALARRELAEGKTISLEALRSEILARRAVKSR